MSMNDVRASKSLLVAVPAVTTAEPLMPSYAVSAGCSGGAGARCVTLYAAHSVLPKLKPLIAPSEHVEADVAAGRLHVLDDGAALAREVQIEAAGAAEVRLARRSSAAISGSSAMPLARPSSASPGSSPAARTRKLPANVPP